MKLAYTLAILTIADLVLTLIGTNMGIPEANPVCAKLSPLELAVVKLALAAVILYCGTLFAGTTRRVQFLYVAIYSGLIVGMGFVVGWNIRQILIW